MCIIPNIPPKSSYISYLSFQLHSGFRVRRFYEKMFLQIYTFPISITLSDITASFKLHGTSINIKQFCDVHYCKVCAV